jgi:hypothetical protein
MFRRRRQTDSLEPVVAPLEPDPEDVALVGKLIEHTECDGLVWTATLDPVSTWMIPAYFYSTEVGGARVVISPIRNALTIGNDAATRKLSEMPQIAQLRTVVEQQAERLRTKLTADVSSALDRSSSGE